MIYPQGKPGARAVLRGNEDAPELRGVAEFYPEGNGTWVAVRVWGLPRDGFFALHIHEGGRCSGKEFADTGGHWNPTGMEHPNHAGDLPPLLASQGQARMLFWTGRFRMKEIIGKTLVIHSGSDDFHTQPSGNSGEKIGCGVIEAVGRGM